MITIYIDVYFFINFFLDYISLFSVKKLLLLPESRLRCTIGAIVGALYSCISFFVELSGLVHLFVVAVMVYMILPRVTPALLVGGCIGFLLCECFVGGCVSAICELSDLMPKSGLFLASFIIIICVLSGYCYSVIQQLLKLRLKSLSLTARLWHRDRCSDIVLMVDSGNLARENTDGRRVLFVKAESIANSIGDADTLFERERCYVIPIVTASGNSTVLGFVPDKIEFSDQKYNREKFIVVPDIRGTSFGGYDGIAPLI